MKFYIASRLENEKNVKTLARQLKKAGYEQSYDWTTHGSAQGKPDNEIMSVAKREYHGAFMADFIVLLLPGARGTHTELGVALASQNVKDIYIWGNSVEDFHKDGRVCSFYYHPKVTRLVCPFKTLAKEIFKDLLVKQ